MMDYDFVNDEKEPSRIFFNLRYIFQRLKEPLSRPERKLRALGLKRGFKVLDVWSGTGVYTIPAAKLVGDKGFVYSMDVDPYAVEVLEKRCEKLGLKNVEIIFSDLETGLEKNSIDAILLHKPKDTEKLIKELKRVSKQGCVLSVMCKQNEEELKRFLHKHNFIFIDKVDGMLRFVYKK